MAGTFRAVLAIRTRKLFDDDVYYASVPGIDGMYGVLPGHELLVGLNQFGGVLTFNLDEAGNDKRQFLVYDGATQVFNSMLTVLGEFAVEVDKIDEAEVTRDAEEAQKRIEALEAQGDDIGEQDRARLIVYRHRLAWDNYQLDYLKNSKN